MVKVYYNGIDVFSGIAPTPFVGISDEMINYGQRWAAAQNITLQGTITGSCSNPFSGVVDKQKLLLNNFTGDFGQLQIIQDGIQQFSGNYTKINNISFDASPYYLALNFKIDTTVYPQSLFTGTFGVLDPVSEIKFSEQEDGTVNITRSFSAKGFQTSNSPITNAITYVRGLTGSSADIITPAFISGISPTLSNLCPRKISENINRLEGSYSVNIDYVLRKNANTSTLFKYSTDFSYDDEKGIYNASIKGSLDGGICKTISDLRNDFSQFNPYSLILSEFPYGYLNPKPNDISIDENETNNIINFSYNYDSEAQDVKVRHSVDISNDYLSDKAEVNFSATFNARGPQAQRLALANAAVLNFDPLPICQQFYLQNSDYSGTPLNTSAKNKKITRDLNNGTVTLTVSYDNSPINTPPIQSATYTLSITPSINKYSPLQFLNGSNGYFDLNYFNRGKISIQGTALLSVPGDNRDLVRSFAVSNLNSFANSIGVTQNTRIRSQDKIDYNITSDMNGYSYNFSIEDTCETTKFVI